MHLEVAWGFATKLFSNIGSCSKLAIGDSLVFLKNPINRWLNVWCTHRIMYYLYIQYDTGSDLACPAIEEPLN